MYFSAEVALFSETPCVRRYFLFYYQAQKQITQMVFRPVNMPRDHGKNMDIFRMDSDHNAFGGK